MSDDEEAAARFDDEEDHSCTQDCWRDCDCGRPGGRFRACKKYRSCYECYLDRLSDYRQCILCDRWHSPLFDTCFACRPESRGRDEAARALRQLILWRDDYGCRYCGALEGEMRVDPRLVRPRCSSGCPYEHNHRLKDDDGERHTMLHVDHVIPCKSDGTADEWNLQTLCSVCNIAKGATWYPGCRHERARTAICRTYFLLAPGYFTAEQRVRFAVELEAFRATGTWDPAIHRSWRSAAAAAREPQWLESAA